MRNSIILTLLLLVSSMASAQWRPNPYFFQFKGVRADSLVQWGVNDTTMYPAALNPGAVVFRRQVGDTSFYYSNGARWDKMGGKIPSNQLDIWNITAAPLLAESPEPIQPTDSLIVALGKLQAQLNVVDGKYIENQTSTYEPGAFRINGPSEIRHTAYPLRLSRDGSGAGRSALIGFNNESGVEIGHLGLGESTARNYLYITNLRSGLYTTIADTSIWFWRTYGPTGAKPYSSWKNGRLLLSDTTFSNDHHYADTAHYPLEIRNQFGHSAVFSRSVVAAQIGIGTGSGAINRALVVSNNGAAGIEIDAAADGAPSFLFFNRATLAMVSGKYRALSHQFEGNIGVGTSTPASGIDIDGPNGYNQLRLRQQYTPSSSSDSNGSIGDIAVDDNYFYYKTSGGWKRAALSTW